MDVCFLGLGGMGHGMAANLAAADLLAAVYNRTPSKATRFAAAHGVEVVEYPRDATTMADVLVLCVSADADVLAMVDALAPGLTTDHIVIDCSTVSSETAKVVGDRVAARGAAFIDAPVSGGTEGAANGSLSIMLGGPAPVVAKVAPVFDAMGDRVTHMGEVGAGQATKAVNQTMVAGVNQAVCEALRFAQALDLPLERVVDVVASGAAGNWLVANRGKTMIADRFEPGFKLAHHQKDLAICQRMAEALGGRLPTVEATRADYAALVDAGWAEHDISVLFRAREDLFGKAGG